MREQRYRKAERELFASAGIDPDERWLELAGIGSTARVLEVGDGEPVVFLSGGPDAAATWSYLAGSTRGIRCILLDRPGTGLSAPPPVIPTVDTLPRYVADLTRDVLDALGLDRASVVGCSFGGYSALRSAIALPDRIDRVVLAGCPAFVPGWRQPGFFSLLRTPVLGRLLLAAPATRTSARMSLKQLGHARSLAAGAIPDPMIDWVRAWQRDTGTMRNDAAMIVPLGTRRHGFDDRLDLRRDELSEVQAPCLVVVGTEDPVGGESVAVALAATLASAQVEVWDGAGHLPWLDDPARMAASIQAFVAA